MKQLFLVAALAMGATGCANDLRPIQIREAQPLNSECQPEEKALYAGSLDIAALNNGATPATFGHIMSFTVASQLEVNPVTVGGATVADEARNNFILEEIEYNFESQPATTIPPERVPAYTVIPVGSQDSRINILLTPPNALQAMKALVDATGKPATLITRFRLKGKLASGTATESDEVSFPITIFNSGTTCTAPETLSFTGPCGGATGVNGSISCEGSAAQP